MLSELIRGREAFGLKDGLRAIQLDVRAHALQHSFEKPGFMGFIIMPGFNPTGGVDADIVKTSAEIIHGALGNLNPEVVLGIGNSGLLIAQELHRLNIRARYAAVEKLGEASGDRAIDGVRLVRAVSHSKQTLYDFEVPEIRYGERVLIGDDAVAYGGILGAIIEALGKQGAQIVGIGAMFDKAFQGGFQTISDNYGVPGFSVVRIQGVDERGMIILMPEEDASKII